MIQHYACYYRSPLGDMTLASDGDALTGAWFDGQKYFGSTLHGSPVTADLPVFRLSRAWLDHYFSGELPDDLPPLRPEGSAFRLAVWDLLNTIPYGTTRTYGDLARELARRTGRNVSAQAVGGAVGHNPLSLFIPCHRVVGSDGSLTGYAGGVRLKERLLRLEGADMTELYIPKQAISHS